MAGTKANKMHSIQDFAACGRHLIKEGFVHQNRLCAIGCSAGGLLVGAVINMLPDLFSAAVLKVSQSVQLDIQIFGQVDGSISYWGFSTYSCFANTHFVQVFIYRYHVFLLKTGPLS
jgi:hypothetical protein